MSNKNKNNKINRLSKGLIRNSFNYKVFSVLAFLIKKTGQEIKNYLDFCLWLDPAALRKHFYGHYYSEIEDLAPTSKQMKESALEEAIKKLELFDYIKIMTDKQNKQKKKISLTKKGVLEFIRYSIDQQKKKQKWDRKWRMVIFDVSEHRRQIRDLLRNRLRWLGFKELQKSAWIFPYDVQKEIEQILSVCHVDIIGDIRFLIIEKMNDDGDLRKYFRLN